MNTNKEITSVINSVLNEDLVQAKFKLQEILNEKLSEIMAEKFEEYAPTIFESSHKKSKKSEKGKTRWQDSDGDGKWYEEGDDVKKSVNEEKYCEDGECEDMEDEDEEAEGKESSGSEEEEGAEDKGGKKDKEEEKD